MLSRTFLPGALVLFACLAHGQGGEPRANVLLIVADDVGVDSIDAYQATPVPARTPNIDRLAEEGVLFRNVWANPTCSSTRALLQTGRYAFRTGIGVIVNPTGYGWGLDPSEVIVPEVLDAHPELGYRHALIGKWHLTNLVTGGNSGPNLAGYGHYAGALDNLEGKKGYYRWPLVVNGEVRPEQSYATATEVDLALEWLEQAEEPWFLHLAFHTAHNPFHAPPDGTYTGSLPNVDPREMPRPFYRAMVENMDGEVQRLLDGLGEARGRTNVIFVGDNGTPHEVLPPPYPAAHGKISPYEPGIRVPLIVQGPAVQQPGRVVKQLVHVVDLFPTVLELCGIDPLGGVPGGPTVDGISVVPYLEDPSHPRLREVLFAEMFFPNGPFDQVPKEFTWRIVRNARYKLIQRETDQLVEEFYDLVTDPLELEDRISAPLGPDAQAALDELRQATLDILDS